MARRYRWNDLIPGRKTVSISVDKDDFGCLSVVINGETYLNCTIAESKLIFAALSRVFGKTESKKLIKVKNSKSEKWI